MRGFDGLTSPVLAFGFFAGESSAFAIPAPPAIAAPIPSATANPPTLPM
ncbi:hypothetical protein [Mycolicibacterium agri]|nr:hypothetical protein [Mycolicibacterium agri]